MSPVNPVISTGTPGSTVSSVPFVLPESFGATGNLTTGTDGTAINNAIKSLATNNKSGIVYLSGRYALNVPIKILHGVTLFFAPGAGWESTQSKWTGFVCPGTNFVGTTLITVGTAGAQGANPDGGRIIYPCLIGKTPATTIPHISGITITDTANFEILEPSIRYIDAGTGSTGTHAGIKFTATVAAGTVDCKVIGGLLHDCNIGITLDSPTIAAGCTDNRIMGVSFEPLSNTNWCCLRMGVSNVSSAGSGTFCHDCHFVLGSSATGHTVIGGSGLKKSVFSACYFDVSKLEQITYAGLGLIITGSYFQASTSQTTKSFIKQAQTVNNRWPACVISGNQFYIAGRPIHAIMQLVSLTGASQDVAGIWTNNQINNLGNAIGTNFKGVLVDSTGTTVITPSNTAHGSIANNVWS